MNVHALSRLALSTVAALLGFATFAQAGPPLICHPIEIGQAKSWPFWILTRLSWCAWKPSAVPQSTLA
jgi:hypothetical protein